MQKRKFGRIRTKIKVKFFCEKVLCSGTMYNFSENGMLINTKISFPFDWEFDVFMLLKEKLLKVPVKIIRLSKGDKYYDIMAVEVLDPPQEYKDFVRSMKSFRKSLMTREFEIQGQLEEDGFINSKTRPRKHGWIREHKRIISVKEKLSMKNQFKSSGNSKWNKESFKEDSS
jgi:hypothetical protein